MYIQFAPIGAKIEGEKIHPIFQIERRYPSNKVYLILSDEPESPLKDSVMENVQEIREIYSKMGVETHELYLKLEHFWQNVGFLATKILESADDIPILLNLSTGRRVFVSALILAGSFSLSWRPQKKIICVQSSRDYPKIVEFEPVPPVIPDKIDWRLLKEVKNNPRISTITLAKMVNKGQSTISIRLNKLANAGYIVIEGHKKKILPKGDAIRQALNTLVEKNLL